MMNEIQSLYSDGACKGNPGPGGWGAVVYFIDGSVAELGGRDKSTTNNRMEMQAAIEALQFFLNSGQQNPCTLYTDSEYVIKGVTSWLKGWKARGWKTAAGKPVLNQDLWQRLDELTTSIRQQAGKALRWEYVKGHSGNVGNDRCDQIASSFALGQPVALQTPSDAILAEPMPTPTTKPKTSITLPTTNSAMSVSHFHEDQHHHGEGENIPRGERVTHLQYLIETLHIAEEIADQGYFITSSELADLMDINAGAVTGRGDHWVWRNWIVSRARKEGNQILWQLERVEVAPEISEAP
jgi:ribonuclease HI